MSVEQVRRSNRIAKLKDGFKDIPVNSVNKDHEDDEDEGHEQDRGALFAHVRDLYAPAPPFLPIETIQAMATGPCQMHPEDVSDDNLNYDSTNDSVE